MIRMECLDVRQTLFIPLSFLFQLSGMDWGTVTTVTVHSAPPREVHGILGILCILAILIIRYSGI